MDQMVLLPMDTSHPMAVLFIGTTLPGLKHNAMTKTASITMLPSGNRSILCLS